MANYKQLKDKDFTIQSSQFSEDSKEKQYI